MPSQSESVFQMFLEYLQVAKMWTAVSEHCWQRAQIPLFGQPCHCRRYEVHSLFWIVSHPKNLHFRGTHAFPNLEWKFVLTDPRNYALYADAVELVPFVVNFLRI